MNRRMLLGLICLLSLVRLSYGQCPTASFALQSSLCLNETIQLTNTSSNGAISYEWNFCSGDLSEDLGVANGSSLGGTLPIDISYAIDNGVWYGFYIDRTANTLNRLTYGSSLNNTTPVITPLGNVDNLLSSPDKIVLHQENGKWYGLVLNLEGTNRLVRLSFQTNLGLAPIATGLGNPDGALNQARGISLAKDGNDLVVVMSNSGDNKIVLLNYGTSILNVPSGVNILKSGVISGGSTLLDMALLKECDTWYGFTTSFGNGNVIRLNFGSSLFSLPTSSLVTSSPVVTSPSSIYFRYDGSSYKGFVSSSNQLFRLDFSSGISETPQVDDLSSTALTNTAGLFFPQDNLGFAIDFSAKRLKRLMFNKACSVSVETSTAFEPKNVSYTQSGTYNIGLRATDANGNSRSTTQIVTVSADVAPDIVFEIDESRCVANSNQFTSINTSGGITSYAWDFGDGGSSTQSDPTYSYVAAGTYEVILTVSNGSCENVYAKTITIYPEPTAASFTLPSGSQCISAPITFNNTTDETGFGEELQYLWDFDGEGSSTDRDAIFTFTTSGLKDIDLVAYVPGCTTAIFTQQLTILEEEPPSFTYTHNCMGENVIFTSTTPSANVVGYTWDFGDGGTSTQTNPTYTFSVATKHPVKLTIETTSGCMIGITDTVTVSFDHLADFSVGQAETNVPISFLGQDLTSDRDEVIAWSWNYNGSEFSTDQNASRIFSSSETYQITLSVQTTQGCVYEVIKDIVVKAAVCPYPDFTVQSSLCLNETLQLTNTSSNGATSYEWDFCPGDLSEDLVVTNGITLSGSLPVDIFHALDGGVWYGFYLDRTANTLNRITYGASLNNTTLIITPLGNIDNLLSSPDKIVLHQESGNWYGLVLNLAGTNSLLRLSFGSSLGLAPTATGLGNPDGVMNQARGIDLAKDGNNLVVVISNSGDNRIVLLNYGMSILNVLSGANILKSNTIVGGSTLLDMALLKECDTWYGFTNSFGNGNVIRLNFGSSLFSLPTSSMVTSSPVVTNPSSIYVRQDGSSYKGFVSSSSQLFRLDFSSGISEDPQVSDLSSVSLTSMAGITFPQDNLGFAIDFSAKRLKRLAFNKACSVNIDKSTSFEPKNISYSQPGTYQIGLKATDANGNSRSTRQTVTVGTDVAPDIDFNYRSINCQDINFAFEVDQDLFSTYEWNFGDGQIDTGAEVSHQFASSGLYDVSVTGKSANGCNNTSIKTINIFSSPPIADFEIQATQLCTNSEISLLNETDVSNYDLGSITYEWSIGNDWASNEKSPMINIDSVGTYEVTLVVHIPGCISDPVSQSFTLLAGAFADFSFETGCEDSPVTFTNLTNDPTATYLWDFGDGFSSTSLEMDHLYASGGIYTVSLTATAASGCFNTIAKEIVVDTSPDVDFEYSLLCTNTPSTFTDLSVADNADIIAWNWFVDDELVSEEQNPAIIFETPGVKNLRMVVFSSSGCEALLSENVFVIDAPALVVTSELGCLGFASVFTDKTGVSQSRLWMVDGVTQSTTGEVLTYVFNTPGQHTVTLIGLQNSGCSSTREEIITIPANPTLTIAVDGSCANQDIYLTDTTALIAGNEIASRTWRLNGSTFGNGAIALLPTSSGGSYEVELIVQTAFGCELTQTKTITLLDAPSASFSLSVDYGVPPFTITTTNLSSGASSYNWYINDLQVATSGSPNFTISSQGTKTVKLVAKNELGCTDSLEIDVISAIAQADLVIEKMEMIPNGSIENVLLEIRNNGNLPVEQLDFTIKLENQFKLVERVNQRIDIGKRAVVTLSTGIPIQNSALAYLCVAVANSESPNDIHLADNERCMSIHSETTILEPPYPNPTAGNTTIRMVLKNAGQVKLTVLDMLGQVHTIQIFDDLSAGLHVVLLDLTALDAGTYLVYIQHPSGEDKYKITKR